MLFNSYVYLLIFLPIALLGFAAIARLSLRAGFVWLIAASIFFYGWWTPESGGRWNLHHIGLLLGSCTGNYFLGCWISRRRNDIAGKAILASGVTLNLLLLGYYKYTGFLLQVLHDLAGWSGQAPKIILPLAISFFTFLQIAYLVDAFRGKTDEHHFTDYLLFVTFFPHLIAGPLVHHSEMIPQFTKRRDKVLRYGDLSVGFTILVMGLFKKVVLADSLAEIASPLFAAAGGAGHPLSMLEGWIAIITYTLQLYFDFSGYSDMAIGSARLFGIRFPLNFQSPYKARSVVDFWRRWHITLSRFLRDYLYFPLGGNRKGPARRYVNLMLTMVIGGIWHGAGWTFLIWGFIHGSLLCLNHAWFALRKKWHLPAIPTPIAIALTFLSVALAWVYFRAPNLDTANAVLSSALGLNRASIGHANTITADLPDVLKLIAAGLAIVWFLPNTQQFLRHYRPALGMREFAENSGKRRWWEWRPIPIFGCIILVILYVTARDFDKVSEFIYFQF